MSPIDAGAAIDTDDQIVAKSAMRKATWRLIPLIAAGYGVAYMDRVNISFASLQMNQDLHFSNTIYGIGAGLFFLSYAACEIPSNLLLYRIGARRWLARIMITWGVIAMGMMFVRTPWQFYSMRFLLGMAEAGFFPGVLFYLCQWFPAHMRARTISRFYVSLPLSSVVMGGIAGAVLGMDGRLGLRGWQWLFLVEGFPSVLLSLFFLRYLPDGPQDAPWLTEQERGWIETKLAAEGSGAPDRQATATHVATAHAANTHAIGVADALQDPRVWLFGLVNLLMLGVSYGYTFSLPAIVQNLTHYDTTHVGFTVSMFGLAGGVGMLLNAWLSDRTGRRYLHIMAPALLEAVCFAVIASVLNPWIAIPALTLMIFSHNAIQGPLLATPTTFLKARGAAAGLATINMVGMLGGVLFPPLMGWFRDRTGNYQTGLGVLAITMTVAAGIVLILRGMARRSTARDLTARDLTARDSITRRK